MFDFCLLTYLSILTNDWTNGELRGLVHISPASCYGALGYRRRDVVVEVLCGFAQ
jgi:hypothetical protein